MDYIREYPLPPYPRQMCIFLPVEWTMKAIVMSQRPCKCSVSIVGSVLISVHTFDRSLLAVSGITMPLSTTCMFSPIVPQQKQDLYMNHLGLLCTVS